MDCLKHFRTSIIGCLLLPTVWSFSESPPKSAVTPAELVRTIRSREDWLHTFKTLYIHAEVEPVSNSETPQSGENTASQKVFLEVAIDTHRIRYYQNDPSYWLQEKVWDGKEFRSWEKYYNHPQNNYILNNTLDGSSYFNELLSCNFGWPRTQPHSFWWDKKNVESLMELYGKAEDFTSGPIQTYREKTCYQLNYCNPELNGLAFRWFVGVDDNNLYGIQTLRNGVKNVEHWFDDYQSVAASGRFPMRRGWMFHEQDEASGERLTRSEYCVTIREFRLNKPLDDELFELVFQPGINIQDVRAGQVREYTLSDKKEVKTGSQTAAAECETVFQNPAAEMYTAQQHNGADGRMSGRPMPGTSLRVHEIELRFTPPLNLETIESSNVRYGKLQFEDAGKSKFNCALIGNQGDGFNQTFYIDLNRNGRWEESERLKGFEPTRKSGMMKTWFGYIDIPLVNDKGTAYSHRVFAVYNHYDQLFVVSHCWKEATITIGGQNKKAFLVDYNCDGRYNSGRPVLEEYLFGETPNADYDYLAWDRNDNGKLDYDEFCHIGSLCVDGDRIYQIAAASDGSQIAVMPLNVPSGQLQLPLADACVRLRGEKGPVTMSDFKQARVLPVGTYYVDFTVYCLPGENAPVRFSKDGRYFHEPWIIEEGKTLTIPRVLLDKTANDEAAYEEKMEAYRLRQELARIDAMDKEFNALTGDVIADFSDFECADGFQMASGRPLLVCFWDYQQRPSRHIVGELAVRQTLLDEYDVQTLLVHVGPMTQQARQWIKSKESSFHVGHISRHADEVLKKWGAKSLPWLILTDVGHQVVAEGFSVKELEERMK